jgi:hypothetical protein
MSAVVDKFDIQPIFSYSSCLECACKFAPNPSLERTGIQRQKQVESKMRATRKACEAANPGRSLA